MSSNIRIPKICEFCDKEFIAKTMYTKYCGDRCAKRAYKERMKAKKLEVVLKKESKVTASKNYIDPEEVEKKEYLSIKEAVVYLGVSERTIYRLLESGDIEKAIVRKRTIIPKESINELIERSML
jgi:excisionase family DNA binding protein